MKTLGAIGVTLMFLFLLASAPAYSQDQGENKPAPQEEKDKAKQQKDKAGRKDEGKRDQEPASESNAARQKEQREQHADNRQQHPAHVKRGRVIPDEKFRASFGRQHTFHVQRTLVINNPQPVVVYGGYSFQLVEAWPAVWAFDDDCYIEYVDGDYFLFDAFHPGIRVAVFVFE